VRVELRFPNQKGRNDFVSTLSVRGVAPDVGGKRPSGFALHQRSQNGLNEGVDSRIASS
jgi:hypothetical protein